ncbi:CPBP family intramembrane metalloprotease [Flammeovirga yaeyamensis]|uniref:CPBP family intramembrane metalloprotease n=1 Tax=Flammeovirga yaeyamensis TaxID=367791 RepID=A0AAX1N0I8_9BACT|nr:CPBP family intramembrane glutamic endopeptidase [Flammeovirga yaeyamensis]MBB3698616.1 hypothetical protein [Flammeovirga yaeyamensis]NMF34036.1 CPBP family intramembrane metalloprotease [Flammeovirga yaeyamensis]QWG01024.1 CPBP family intramembrane metalloprotease [Flammeovirga yaeyamensis]
MQELLHSFWQKKLSFDVKTGCILIGIFCFPRFLLVLHANQTSSYQFIGLVMTIYAITPFLFLNKAGRKHIGLQLPQNYNWLMLALIIGVSFSLLLYVVGILLYSDSYQNWYVYIGKSYNIQEGMPADQKLIMFFIMAITGMIFSPIGEEFLFRGLIHESFAASLGDQKASMIDSLAFAITHISHFGLVFINNQWDFYLLPCLLWVAGMYVVSRLFFYYKMKIQSIWGAVLCHSGFNLGMTYCIFYLL